MVPSGWVRHLGSDITTKITKGSSPKWQGFDYQSEGTLFVTSENVRDGFLDVSKPKYLPLEFNQKLKNSQLQQGDILINIVGASIGRSCQYDLSEQQANINQAVCLFRTNELAESDFIQQYLQLPSTINRLLGTQSESARPNLSLSDMRDFLFALPPLPEQRKIAKILSTWDKAISTTEKLIETSKQQKKALMQQLLTGKKRLVNPETGKAFEGEWEEVTFDHALSKLTDYTANGSFAALADNVSVYDESNYALWIMGRSLKSGDFVKDVRYTDKRGYDFLKKTKLFGGELLMPKTGDVGKAYLFPKLNQKATLADNVFLLDFKDFIINEYARYYINSEYFQFELERTMYGTSQKTIVKKSLRKMKIILPSVLEQTLIVTVLDKADKEIEVLEAKLAHFKQEKKALMQQLLTGKRRVKVNEYVAAQHVS